MQVSASFAFHLPAKSELKIKKDDLVEAGDLITPSYKSPFKGKVTQASEGKVVLSFPALEIKGKWGVGGRKIGTLVCLEKKQADLFDLQGDFEDKLLALTGCFNRGFWYKAVSLGLAGILAADLINQPESFRQEIQEEEGLPLVFWQNKADLEPIWPLLLKNESRQILIEGKKARILIPL